MNVDGTKSLAPVALSIDRLGEREELILAQSTSQCCRCCCFQPSINWVVAEGNNFTPGTDPFELDSVGWIHEESSFGGRSWSWILPGCRAVKYVQHAGPAPASIMQENQGWFTCQREEVTTGLEESDRQSNVVAIHEKNCTCGYCITFPIAFPICGCFPLPYLETKNSATGQVLGKTVYVCDHCCFVPKFDVYNASNEKVYRLRPDTCVAGLCVRCRCNGKKGKCCRVPFLIRNPSTKEPLMAIAAANAKPSSGDGNIHDKEGSEGISSPASNLAQVDVLWAGWKHACCTQKNAYHLAFPQGITAEEKLVLMGSTVLVDLAIFEQQQDD